MTGNKGNWSIAMKDILRSPSPANRISFDRASSPAPSQGHRQSVDNFLSRLGPGMLDSSFNLEERSGPLEPYRRNGRRSHAINAKGSEVKKAVGDHNVQLQVQSNNNVMMKKNKLQMQSSHMNNSNKLQIQSTNSINNGNNLQMQNGSSISSNDSRPVLRQKVVLRTQQDQSRHARAVAAASAAAAEAAAAAAQAAAEIVRLTCAAHQYSAGALKHLPLDHSIIIIARQAERAATMIQSAYRGHLARQALRALKGLVKLQAVVRGHLVRRQARISLRCMQALVRLQAKVRARQVKGALGSSCESAANKQGAAHKAQQQMRAREAFLLCDSSYKKQVQEIAARGQRPLQLQDQSGSPRSSILHNNSGHHHHQLQHLKVLQETSTPRTSSLLSSNDSRDWDSSALSKEEIEFKVLKKQYAMAMRQKALAYAETHQRTPRLSGLSRRASGDYKQQQQQQRYTRLSFNETEPEKLHRDWSWLEGWMAAHGAASLWESNAAALWESRDELRERGEGEEEEDGEKEALLFDQTSCDDDHPAIKIIEMDRPAPTPPPPPRPSYRLSPASPRPQQYSLSRNSHNIDYSHRYPLPQSSVHYAGSAASPRRSLPQRPTVRL